MVVDFDPVPYLRETEAPILWVYGDTDDQSELARNIALIERLRRDHGRNFNLMVTPAAGHGLLAPVDQVSRGTWPMQMQAGIWETVLRWIDRSLKSGEQAAAQ